ncbi:oligosaccharide flippase family protein [Bacillus sp. ISL-35]|uniref:oligosaccharide flippase family protein n=1 Tax=Bacillus sp. ISL-35 TaxID=2819122 RepID=UPI001BE53FF2|nr:oligosaccharide flippase family protein [Bacillus sp. ISL-35]MBT2678823.1 oligosaccharide flippase family protein [Bacillus sp. ISL-35]MBT2703815.1 oligosaccharide flippase family protein [Chryseobacterium sp. ISL-80]
MNQIRIGALLSYISIFLTFIVGFIYTPILIRILGQTDYGIYSLILAFASYLSLMDMGVGNAIVRYIARNRVLGDSNKESDLIGHFLKFFLVISLFTIVVGVLICINAPFFFQNSLETPDIKTAQIMIIILTINFALSFPLNVYSSVLQAYERFIFLKLFSIIRIVIVPIVTLISLTIGYRLIAMTVISSSVNIIILIIGYLYCKKVIGIKVTYSPINLNYKKEIYSYALLIFLTAIADKIYWQTDQILLGILKNPESVAIYAVAIQFIFIFISLSGALSTLFLPQITKLVTEENHISRLDELFIKISKYQFFILALVFSGFFLFGQDFIILWAGQTFEQAYIIVIILMIPFFFDLVQNTGLVILQAKGLYLFRTISLIVCSILNIVISIPIINLYGSIGTAIVTSLFVAIGNVILLNVYYHYKVGLNIKLYWKNIISITVPILLLVTFIYIIIFNQRMQIMELIIWIVLYTVLYTAVIYFFCFSTTEKRALKRTLSNIISIVIKI